LKILQENSAIERAGMKVTGILIMIHVGSNEGYAIAPLERTFFLMAKQIVEKRSQIHFAYRDLARGHPETLPGDFRNVIAFDFKRPGTEDRQKISTYLIANHINVVFGFDLSLEQECNKWFRQAGVKKIIAYWGAPISGINNWPKLWLKKIEVLFRQYKPDHFIFESESMRSTAVRGRGIGIDRTCVVPLGVDTNRFKFTSENMSYAYEQFGIPKKRKIIFYSGHFIPIKGIEVIMKSAVELCGQRARKDIHFLLLGNRPGEEKMYHEMIQGTAAESFVTFGGYRHDIAQIMQSAYVGVIMSIGWDSFTMSSMEMAASGLPLIVSRIGGLPETIEEGVTGFCVEPGDFTGLAEQIEFFMDNPETRNKFGRAAAKRIEEGFSQKIQIANLARVILKEE